MDAHLGAQVPRKGLGEGEREREDGHREHLVELLEGRLLLGVALVPLSRCGDAIKRRGAGVVLGLDVRSGHKFRV